MHTRGVTVALAIGVLAAGLPALAEPEPTHRFVPPAGASLGEAFALDEEGRQLAYVTSTGGKSVVLHMVDLTSPPRHREIPGIGGRVYSLLWLGETRVLVVTRPGSSRRLMATMVNGAGNRGPTVGPADHIALSRYQGRPAIIVYQAPRGASPKHTISALDVASMRPLVQRTIDVDKQGMLEVGSQRVRLLWWGDDFSFAAVRHPGQYDPARDVRLPDRFGRVNLLTGTLVDDRPIDPAGFARLTSWQRLHPGETAFVHVDARDRQPWLIDATRAWRLQGRRPAQHYDPAGFGWQRLDSDRILVSLSLDSLNPQAVARKQRDRNDLEFYSVDRHTGAMTLRTVIDGGNRPVRWQAGGDRLALLRKHRTFPRGGVALDVYPLALPATARAPSP